jgi:hypothetical protein
MLNKIRTIFAWFFVIILTQIINANPISPCAQEFNPISEIQIIDSTHWSIEINGDLYPGGKLDSVYIGIKKTGTSSVIDTYFISVNRNGFDSLGFAVITGTNFPNMKIFKKQTIILQAILNNYGMPCNFSINIDSTLHSNQSLVRVPTECWYDDNFGMGQPDWQLEGNIVYAKCNLPTIGKTNNLTGILNFLRGRIIDPKNNLLHGITINNNPNLGGCLVAPNYGISFFSTHTDSAGRFSVQQIASFPSRFTFFDSTGKDTISKKILGPFYGEPDSTIDVGDFVLDDYIPTGVVNKHFGQTKNASTSLNVLGVFTSTNRKGVKIVIANNANASSPITISILTVKGQKIRDMSAAISGAGTTTINWDGKNAFGKKVLAGTYIVTILVTT